MASDCSQASIWQEAAVVDMQALSPRQLGVLIGGCVVTTFWPLLTNRLNVFEAEGLRSLAECWVVLWFAVAAGRLVWCACLQWIRSFAQQAAAAGAAARAGGAGGPGAWALGKGMLAGGALELAAAPGPAGEGPSGGDDDVCAEKRRAQAEQAAADAASQAAVDAALAALRTALRAGRGGAAAGLPAAAAALRALAEALLDSPVAPGQAAAAGAAAELGGAVAATAAALGAARAAGAPQPPDAVPALLQASWVAVQLAHGPPAARAALAAPPGAAALAGLLAAALGPPADGDDAAARAAVLRNAALSALLLVEGSVLPPADGRSAAALRAGEALAAAGALPQLSRVLAFDGAAGAAAAVAAGPAAAAAAAAPAALAAGALAALVCGGAGGRAPALQGAALDALLEPAALHGVVYLTSEANAGAPGAVGGLAAAPGASRALSLLAAALPRALAARPAAALRGLVEERLVGPALAAAPRRLAQLIVAHLASSAGQDALDAVEAEWALDAPVALAQALVAPGAHLRLPSGGAAPPPAPGSASNAEPEGVDGLERAGSASSGSSRASGASALLERGPDDVYTDVLLARLLLRGGRLMELAAAFVDATADDDGGAGIAAAAAAPAPAGADAAAAAAALAAHLAARAPELARVQVTRGDSVADSDSSGAPSSGAPPSGAPPAAGACCDDARGCGCVAHSAGPWTGAGADDAAPRRSGAGPVAFVFGPHEHRMPAASYRRLRRASKLLHSVLVRAEPAPADASGDDAASPALVISELGVPRFSDAASWWALTRLELWAAAAGAGALGLAGEPRRAALLWAAAEFWQVDGLQTACEDALGAALSEAQAPAAGGAPPADGFAELLALALSLCARHPLSGARLLRIAARALLAAAGGGAGDGALWRGGAAGVAALHRGALVGAIHDELRDQLVSLCVSNAGSLDADSPEEAVE
ncbi:MAG: hypothetical protein J3K34DRAFT_523116 [Monoraphidium minutum]|nr:MAG: hypothetical protein J3K34DRAFT_523116 [Monoraphidium minutum]